MIEAATTDRAGFARRLADRAGRIAAAYAERQALARRRDPARWRRASLLWPLIARND